MDKNDFLKIRKNFCFKGHHKNVKQQKQRMGENICVLISVPYAECKKISYKLTVERQPN